LQAQADNAEKKGRPADAARIAASAAGPKGRSAATS
jgi:hypothetical protein